jgi:hypothetical protein
MKYVFITPCENCVLAEFRQKVSENLRQIVNQTPWLRWENMRDVNGKGHMQWYIVADTSSDKENRLTEFAEILCNKEQYYPSPRICPHDLYYEDFECFFQKYKEG